MMAASFRVAYNSMDPTLSKPLLDTVMTMSQVPDAAQFSLTVNGTVPYPGTGQVTLKLVDGSTGYIEAVDVFSWVRNGSVITLANPDAVNDWALSEGGTASKIEYQLVPWQVSSSGGSETMVVSAVYEGETKATSFASYCVTESGWQKKVASICQ